MAYQLIEESVNVTKSAKLSLDFSLPELHDTIIRATPTMERAHTAAEIFSSSSQIPTELLADTTIHNVFAASYVWQNTVFTLMVLCYYFFVIYRFKQNIPPLFKVAFSLKKTHNLYEIQSNAQSNLTYQTFFLCILSFSTYALTLTRTQEIFDPFAFIGIVFAATFVWFICKWIVHLICAGFSDNKEAFANLVKIHNQSIGVIAIASTPVVVITAIESSYIAVATVTIIILWMYYMFRILQFFLYIGFGGLQWILYLCAVELLPISFAVAIATRL